MTPSELFLSRKARAKRLKELRLKKGITKANLIAITGLTRRTIDRVESGEYDFSTDTETLYLSGLKKKQNAKSNKPATVRTDHRH